VIFTNFDNVARAFAAEVQKKNAELSTRIINEVKAIIAEISREKKLNMIVDVNSVIFSEDIPDLTEEVLIRYNLWYSKQAGAN
jgi:Skp family chaperone for outer membrane proteins